MQIKTSELTGAALDWAVAKCEEHQAARETDIFQFNDWFFNPSTDWAQGGPIIERKGINLFKYNKLDTNEPDKWCGHKVVPRQNMEGGTNMTAIAPDGPTPLIAAMRCYVASKLGHEVNVPEVLV